MAEKAVTAPAGLARHDMVYLTPAALEQARAAACRRNPGLATVDAERWLTPDIPAIITRQRHRRTNGMWDAGFSLPMHMQGVRLRFGSVVPQGGITRVATPFDVAEGTLDALDETQRALLDALRQLGKACGLRVGVYGSLALQALTGLEYTTAESDYDIFVCAADADKPPDALRFYNSVTALEKAHAAKIDVEVACLEDSGAKLAELFCGQRTVLCKGLYGVQLCPVEQLTLLISPAVRRYPCARPDSP